MKLLFIGLVMLSVGCGAASGGSCQVPAVGAAGGTCIDFTKGYTSDQGKSVCAANSTATYSASACVATNRVGRCTMNSPDNAFTQVLNYYGPTTTADAMTACTAAGTGGSTTTFAAN